MLLLKHDLRRVLRPGEVHERRRRVGARELVVLATELLQEGALPGEPVARRAPEPVRGPDVDPEQLPPCTRSHARGAPDHVVATRRAGDGDDNPPLATAARAISHS